MSFIYSRRTHGVVRLHRLLQGGDSLVRGEAWYRPHQGELDRRVAIAVDKNSGWFAKFVPVDYYAGVRRKGISIDIRHTQR